MYTMQKSLRTYTNPVYGGYLADPFAFRFEGAYYAVGTSASEGRVFPMLRSDDFVHWEPIGGALVRPSADLGGDFWAPEIAEFEGRFYLYYSVGWGDTRHKLRVAVASDPHGPYEDAGVNLVDPQRHSFAIDASPFRDDDGQWYLFYARDFLDSENGARAGTALVVDRMISMTALAGEDRVVLRATHDWQRFMKDRPIYGGVYDWHTLEGPSVRKHEGRYYCFYSGGRWESDTYGVDYAVADHPLGPWTDTSVGIPRVLKTVPGHVIGPGHNSIVTGPDGNDYIVYHAWDMEKTARRMCIDKLEWTPDGPRCLGPTWTPQTL